MTPERIQQALANHSIVLEDPEKPTYYVMMAAYVGSLLLGFSLFAIWALWVPALFPLVILGTVVGIIDYATELAVRVAGFDMVREAMEERDSSDPRCLAQYVGVAKFLREIESYPEPRRFADAILMNLLLWALSLKEIWKRIQRIRSR